MNVIKRWFGIVGIVSVLLATAAAAEEKPYVTADLKSQIFKGEITLDKADRQKTAMALAGLLRNEVLFTHKQDYLTARRIIGLALRLDKDNVDAAAMDAALREDHVLKPVKQWSKEEGLGQVRKVAEMERDTKNKPDQMLAAYLYGAIMMVAPDDACAKEAAALKKAGFAPVWYWADGRGGNSGGLPAPEVRDVCTVRGLVVSRLSDGNYHGKAVEIIATPGKATSFGSGIKIIGEIGREMQIALEEATRLAKNRHEGADRAAIEISFSDKYSPKDGGSAGTAFTLLILSAVGDFDLATDAAITGDITVDGKVRPVGAVPTKVHGAALDKCRLMSIPTSNIKQMEDAIVLRGAAAMWEIQVLSSDTLDDAIAVMRKDRDAKLVEALRLFDELRTECAGKEPEQAFAVAATRSKMARVLELAPNHVSAKYLLQLADGKRPTRLSLMTTLDEGFAAMGVMRSGLQQPRAELATATALDAASRGIAAIKKIGDPTAAPVLDAILNFCVAYEIWAKDSHVLDLQDKSIAAEEFRAKHRELVAALAKVTTDREVIDQWLHAE